MSGASTDGWAGHIPGKPSSVTGKATKMSKVISPKSPNQSSPKSPNKGSPKSPDGVSPKVGCALNPDSPQSPRRKSDQASSAGRSSLRSYLEGEIALAGGAQSPRSVGGSKVSASERSHRSNNSRREKEQAYWDEAQPVGGRVDAYGLEVCVDNFEKHDTMVAWHNGTTCRAVDRPDGKKFAPGEAKTVNASSKASSRRERTKEVKEPSALPRAGYKVQQRTCAPVNMAACKNTLDFVPESEAAPSVASQAPTAGELSNSQFDSIKHQVGQRMTGKYKTVQKAFRTTTGAQLGTGEINKDDFFKLFKAAGYSRNVSDKFFNKMDEGKCGQLTQSTFAEHFGPAIQPEYEQEKGSQGYMVTTQGFFHDAKHKYETPTY